MIELPVADGHLVLEGQDWCVVSLRVGGSLTKLGAEAFNVLAPRILKNVTAPGTQSIGEISGHVVHWLVSLAEDHHTLYVHFASTHRLIFIESPSGTCIWHGVLTEPQLKLWEQILATYA